MKLSEIQKTTKDNPVSEIKDQIESEIDKAKVTSRI